MSSCELLPLSSPMMSIWPRLFDTSGLEAIPRSGKMDGFPQCPALGTCALIAAIAFAHSALRASKRTRCQGAANGNFSLIQSHEKSPSATRDNAVATGMNVVERFSLDKANHHSRLLERVRVT